ncbi:class III lanthionine synthetase LanKC [Xanthomonas nasturtii]|uniref:class III lanthionine synthetase LanKC n=1 Tax=Xanthomonas nasturtii TaxID=1843581 RepID=UPI002B23007D|nr:class III lanthionine synthetase LanKC [Xanthomonas nasturtii]MEA9580419.1 class III lanthionine synthetase LanKC [Xanthomonas nasturtii]
MPTIPKFGYTLSHPEFYESLDYLKVDDNAYFRGVRAVLPEEWRIVRNSIWYHCIAPNHTSLDQGWKIHLSAVTHGVSDTLNATLPALIRHGCSFKFAADPNILFLLTSKQWARGGSGKFMTIYPRSTEHFHELIEELHQATKNLEGPYILSDRRYKSSKCVFYRYGGISGLSELRIKGDRYSYLLSPSGEKIPDQRQAFYHMPAWVEKPSFADAEAQVDGALTLKDGRYTIESALRHTNTGGIYLARDRNTGDQVVIKEARPKTNVDVTGSESINLLCKEYRLLQKLAHADVGPRAIDFFEEWEHSFLVEEFLEGMTLRHHAVLHNLTRTVQPSKQYFDEFYSNFKPVFLGLNEVVRRLADNGVVFRDLSPTNVLILKDGRTRLVDFEAATEIGIDRQSNLFTPGFASADIFKSDTPDYSNDLFSIGALMFAYLMPIHAALGLDDVIHERFIPLIGKEYGLPESLVSLMLRLMDKDPARRPRADEVSGLLENPSPARNPEFASVDHVSAEEVQECVKGIVQYAMHHATTNRSDRLFPSDPTVFVTNPLSVGYGACGVALALKTLTGEVPAFIRDWILHHPVAAEHYPPGLLLGMSGIAWTLLELGHHESALAILESSRKHPIAPTFDLSYGLAGQGLTSLRFYRATARAEDLAHAMMCGDRLLEARSRAGADVGLAWVGPDGVLFGLARGASGIALFLLYLHLATGDNKYIEAGREALDFDLATAISMNDGLLFPNRNGAERSVVPYYEFGSAGVGAVLLRYHRLIGDERYLTALRGIKNATIRRYAIFPQKAFGLAGLGDFLIDMANHGIDEIECLQGAHRVARGILLFQMRRGEEGIAFPGDELWKISCDYLTGSAGIGLFLGRLHSRAAPEFFLDELFELRDNAAPTTALITAA